VREHLFEDSIGMPNVHESISLGSLVDAQQTRESLEGKHICPYCGAVNDSPSGPCPNCSLENTPAGRKATKSRIGPWYVLQRRNPAAPGMKYDMLLNFVRKGRVKPRTVVRGPTTHQLWRFAAHVKGLSREFGLCYSCGEKIEPTSTVCPQCNRLQLPPLNPDALLETGDAESPPGALPMSVDSGATTNGLGYSVQTEALIEAPPEEEANHDIVVPALTDSPSEPAVAIAEAAASTEIPVQSEPVAEPAADSAPIKLPAVSETLARSMSLETVPMPAPAAEVPVGARARSAALKAGGLMGTSAAVAGIGGPRIMPLGPAGASPTPVLTADGPPVTFRTTRTPWRGVAEVVLFLVVLVGALGGGLLLVDASLREWVQTTYDRALKGAHLKSDTDQSIPPTDQTDPALTDTPPIPVDHLPPAPAPAPSLGATNIAPKPADVPVPAAVAPVPAPVVANTPQLTDTPAPAPDNNDPTLAHEGTSTTDSAAEWVLYRAAKKAEGDGDFAAAVKDYQQIMKFPASLRQTDVESNLRYDQRLIDSATH
jgi:hypothetical protein